MTPRPRTPARRLLAAAAAIALLAAGAIASAWTSTAATPPVDNTVVNYDTFGARVDAHDGDLLQIADGTIYLYGTSYASGFKLLTPGTPYGGVRIYKTRDLRTWEPAGAVAHQYAFDFLTPSWQDLCAPPAYGCYRPHVVQRSDGVFVMWLDVHGDAGYKILTSTSPEGPFVDTGIVPSLAVKPASGGLRYGDEDITLAPDGTGYVSYTVIWPTTNEHAVVVEQLDPTLTTGTGQYVQLDTAPGTELVEAPGLFLAPTGVWHMTYSNPARPYEVTGTGIMNAPTPLGPWTAPRALSADSCSGQPTGVWPLKGVSGTTYYVWGTDRWVSGQPNQAEANNYYGPLTFTANGGTAIDAAACVATWTLQ